MVDDQIKLINLDHYKLRSYFCRNKQRGGSACILVRDMLRVKQVHNLCGIAQEKTFELAAVELLDIKIVIVCIYRSPESDIEVFLNKLEIVIKRIQNHNKRLIMCGDWNVNFCQNNSNLFKLLSVLERYNLINRITTPTRITNTSCTLIDVIITQASNWDIKVVNKEIGFSDHTAQILHLGLKEPLKMIIHKNKRDFTKMNIEQFKLRLKEEVWDNVYRADEINTSYQNFLGIIDYYFNIAFPLKRGAIKK
jgi:hypothetical protein